VLTGCHGVTLKLRLAITPVIADRAENSPMPDAAAAGTARVTENAPELFVDAAANVLDVPVESVNLVVIVSLPG
jgi:hypothetical protein